MGVFPCSPEKADDWVNRMFGDFLVSERARQFKWLNEDSTLD